MYRAKVCAHGNEAAILQRRCGTNYVNFLPERKTVSNKIYTLMQLYGLRMKKGTKIHDHLRQLDELADQLTAIADVSEVCGVAAKRARKLSNSCYMLS